MSTCFNDHMSTYLYVIILICLEALMITYLGSNALMIACSHALIFTHMCTPVDHEMSLGFET